MLQRLDSGQFNWYMPLLNMQNQILFTIQYQWSCIMHESSSSMNVTRTPIYMTDNKFKMFLVKNKLITISLWWAITSVLDIMFKAFRSKKNLDMHQLVQKGDVGFKVSQPERVKATIVVVLDIFTQTHSYSQLPLYLP